MTDNGMTQHVVGKQCYPTFNADLIMECTSTVCDANPFLRLLLAGFHTGGHQQKTRTRPMTNKYRGSLDPFDYRAAEGEDK